MNLSDFQTVLIPSKKTGALHFYHKPSKAIMEAAFSRPDVGATSGASVLNKDGNLIELAEDEPDWNFQIEGGCPLIQMRPQRTNLIPNSVGNLSAWGEFKILGGSVTFNTNEGLSPDGTSNAFGIKEVATTSNHNWYIDNLTVSDATQYTVSFYAKSLGGRNIRLDEGGAGFNVEGIVDLSNGNVLADTFGNITVVSAGNGWYRIKATGITSGTSQRLIFNACDGTTLVYAGDSSKGVLLYGLQYEEGGSATSLIQTIGSIVTRSSNQYTLDLSSYLSENVVSFYVEASFGVTQQDLFRFGDGGNSNLVAIGIDNQKLRGRFRIAGGSYSSTGVGSATVPLNQIVKIAGVISPAGLKLSFGGAIDLNAAIDLSSLPLISALKSGAIFDTLFPHEIKTIALTPVELSDDQIKSVTA